VSLQNRTVASYALETVRHQNRTVSSHALETVRHQNRTVSSHALETARLQNRTVASHALETVRLENRIFFACVGSRVSKKHEISRTPLCGLAFDDAETARVELEEVRDLIVGFGGAAGDEPGGRRTGAANAGSSGHKLQKVEGDVLIAPSAVG
jgi:hypothetical protein